MFSSGNWNSNGNWLCSFFSQNLFLYSYEYKWIVKQKKLKHWHILKLFRSSSRSRYIDDLFMINNTDHMETYMSDIYPKELVLVPDDTDGQACPFLDLQVVITDNIIYFYLWQTGCLWFSHREFPNSDWQYPSKKFLWSFYLWVGTICSCLFILWRFWVSSVISGDEAQKTRFFLQTFKGYFHQVRQYPYSVGTKIRLSSRIPLQKVDVVQTLVKRTAFFFLPSLSSYMSLLYISQQSC